MSRIVKIICAYAILLLLAFPVCLGQTGKATVSGYIRDEANGEDLIGATVFVQESKTGVATNAYGFYAMTLPAGKYTLVFTYVGYSPQTRTVDMTTGNAKLDVALSQEGVQMQEVVVTADRPEDNVNRIDMSVNKLDIKTIKAVPALLGEPDVLRSIQLLPGISSVGEGAAGYNARGGGIDQNLVLQDEATVYNTSHLFGFFSAFNPDAVKDIKLIKGGIPAQYGGRLSSILDVRLKEGNNRKFETNGGIGFIFSRLSIEGPLKKDKGSFILAGRRSYIDVLAGPFLNATQQGAQLYFYDLTAKANWDFDRKNKVFLSGYLGRDQFGARGLFGNGYGNATATLRWNHIYGDKLFSNLTLHYSNYDYRLEFTQSNNSFDWKSNVINYSVKPEFNWYLNTRNSITFGGQAIFYDFRPGSAVSINQGVETRLGLDNKYALESALFVSNEQTLNSRLSLQYGLRYSYWNYLGRGRAYTYAGRPQYRFNENPRPITPLDTATYGSGESIQTYGNWEPRFSVKYEVDASSSIKASYNRMAQYIHLLSNTTASSPLDVWTPSTNNIRPQIADQIALGYFRNFKDNTYEASVEVYFKDLQNQIDFIPNANLLLNDNIEGEVLYGKGRAYGLELYIKKNTGRLTGWLSYTLARTERQINGVNRNEWYPTRFDRTHNLNLSAILQLNGRWSFSSNFVLQSGTPATFPTDRVEFQGYTSLPYIGDYSRNNVRIPASHRLDVSATLQTKPGKLFGRTFEKYWVFSVYNLYNRRNPYSIFFRSNPDTGQTEAVQYSIVGSFIPSVAFNFKF